jgi:hypothetical protein
MSIIETHKKLLLPIIADYRKRSYEHWLGRVDREEMTFGLTSENGTECQVEVMVF